MALIKGVKITDETNICPKDTLQKLVFGKSSYRESVPSATEFFKIQLRFFFVATNRGRGFTQQKVDLGLKSTKNPFLECMEFLSSLGQFWVPIAFVESELMDQM